MSKTIYPAQIARAIAEQKATLLVSRTLAGTNYALRFDQNTLQVGVEGANTLARICPLSVTDAIIVVTGFLDGHDIDLAMKALIAEGIDLLPEDTTALGQLDFIEGMKRKDKAKAYRPQTVVIDDPIQAAEDLKPYAFLVGFISDTGGFYLLAWAADSVKGYIAHIDGCDEVFHEVTKGYATVTTNEELHQLQTDLGIAEVVSTCTHQALVYLHDNIGESLQRVLFRSMTPKAATRFIKAASVNFRGGLH